MKSTLAILSTGCDRAPAESPKFRPTIAVIPKGSIHEYWKSVHAGAVIAGRELDVEIVWKGYMMMAGLVLDVKAAVAAAAEVVRAKGLLVSAVTIPGPSRELFTDYI